MRLVNLLFLVFLTLGTAAAQRVPHVAIMLPFDAVGIEGKRSVEFTRGFLMAAEMLKHNGKHAVIDLYTEPNQKADMEGALIKLNPSQTDLLIGPVYPSHFGSVSRFSSRHTLLTAVPFSSRIEQIETNPFLITLNAPETYRQSCAADLIVKAFGKHANLIVVETASANERGFTSALARIVSDRGYTKSVLSNGFSTEQLHRAVKVGQHNLIIADDSSDAVMESLTKGVAVFRAQYPGFSISVIGYSEWMASNQQESFYQLDTYIVTPSFYNSYSSETLNLETLYKTNFNVAPEHTTPRMFLLGYDFGLYALTKLSDRKDFVESKLTSPYYQTEFRLQRPAPGAGFVNTCVFMLHFKPDHSIDKIGLRG